jgi:hypothetical protein
MAPEQLKGEPLDGRCDVFACGVLLFELLTGRPPFGGTQFVEITQNILNQATPRASDQSPDVTAGLEQVLQQSLQKDRTLRVPSVGHLRQALAAAAVDAAAGEEGPTPGAPSELRNWVAVDSHSTLADLLATVKPAELAGKVDPGSLPRSFPVQVDVSLTDPTRAFFSDSTRAPSGLERTQPLYGKSLRWQRALAGWRSRTVGLLLVLLVGVVWLLGFPVGQSDGPNEPTLEAIAASRDEGPPAEEPLPALLEKKPLVSQAPPREPCTNLGFLQRERCLWTQCQTNRYRNHAVCARFR